MLAAVKKETMGNRLSYSQLRLYSECGQKYKYYYLDKLRERTKSGALFFGTAIDKAVESALQHPEQDEKLVFDKTWTHQEVNGKMTYLPDSTLVVYAQSDMDWDLITSEDLSFICAKKEELLPEAADITVKEAYNACATAKKQRAFRTFKESENKFLNICNWFSLRRKGYLMLEAHRREVMPKISKLVDTQVRIDLTNGDGDSLVGYADMVCHWLDDSEPTIFDYKTSSIEYEEDSARTSPQLTIYAHAKGIRKVGYIVFRKQISKNRTKVCGVCGFEGTGSRAKTCTNEASGSRCGGEWIEEIKPTVEIQIITDKVPEQTENVVLENVDAINRAIQAKVFVRNFDSCKKAYGTCPYYNLCFHNKKDDLEQA